MCSLRGQSALPKGPRRRCRTVPPASARPVRPFPEAVRRCRASGTDVWRPASSRATGHRQTTVGIVTKGHTVPSEVRQALTTVGPRAGPSVLAVVGEFHRRREKKKLRLSSPFFFFIIFSVVMFLKQSSSFVLYLLFCFSLFPLANASCANCVLTSA